jgi:hypothetical protein
MSFSKLASRIGVAASAAVVSSTLVYALYPYWAEGKQLRTNYQSSIKKPLQYLDEIATYKQFEQRILYTPGDPGYKSVIGDRYVSSWQYTHDVKYGFAPCAAAGDALEKLYAQLIGVRDRIHTDSVVRNLLMTVGAWAADGLPLRIPFFSRVCENKRVVVEGHRQTRNRILSDLAFYAKKPEIVELQQYWETAYREFNRVLAPYAVVLPRMSTEWSKMSDDQWEQLRNKLARVRTLQATESALSAVLVNKEKLWQAWETYMQKPENKDMLAMDANAYILNHTEEGALLLKAFQLEYDAWVSLGMSHLRHPPNDPFLYKLVQEAWWLTPNNNKILSFPIDKYLYAVRQLDRDLPKLIEAHAQQEIRKRTC